MQNILTEATYALNNVPTLKSLLGTVISWRMFEIFVQNKSQLAKFIPENTFDAIAGFLEDPNNSTAVKCGFSIMSSILLMICDLDSQKRRPIGDRRLYLYVIPDSSASVFLQKIRHLSVCRQ